MLYSDFLLIIFTKLSISLRFLTKERAIQSTFSFIAKMASLTSLSVSGDKEIFVLGRLKPLLDLTSPPWITSAII